MNLRITLYTGLLTVAASCMFPALSDAEGSKLAPPTARALALGGATTALLSEPSGIFSNAAALSYLRGTNLCLGATVTMPDYEFRGVLPATLPSKMTPQSIFPPSVALSHTFANGLGIGITAGTPYQTKTSWGETWIGSPIVIASEMRGVEVSPAVGFRVSEDLSIGVGLNAMFVRMDHTRRYGSVADATTGRYSTMSMTGSADVAYGFNVGLMYSPGDALALGLSLKSKTTSEIENGTVTYTGNVGEGSGTTTPPSSFATTITLPERLRAGVMLRPLSSVLVTGEVAFDRWSSVKGVILRLGTPATTRLVDQSGWKDVLSYRGGVEIALGEVLLRGGLGVEPSPIPDAEARPSIPDADNFHYSVGLGYAVEEGLMLDLALQVNSFTDRVVTDSHVQYDADKYFNGIYALASTVLALTISYSWK